MDLTGFLSVAAFLLLGPLAGGLLAGVDRIVTARMQGRKGPPLLQPFYDAGKLLQKERLVVNSSQTFYVWAFFAFVLVSGVLFFSGGDLLLSVFALAVAGVALALGAFSVNSPYSHIGAERELLQMMAYEPMLLLTAMGLYLSAGSFNVRDILAVDRPLMAELPGVFLGFLFILTIKLRKSPFDLSTSHHGHQEIVKGVTTEYSGPDLALIEIAHWYENILLLGYVCLFFVPLHPALAAAAALATYLLEVFVDNTHARLKWQHTVKLSWLAAAAFGLSNIAILDYLK